MKDQKRFLLLLAGILILGLGAGSGCRKKQPEVEVENPAPPQATSAPFTLQIDPATIKLEQGSRTRLKVHVSRKSYFGALTLESRNFPEQVSLKPTIIPAGQSTGEVEVIAGPQAGLGDKKDAQLACLVEGNQTALVLQPLPITVVEPPFTLEIEPDHFQVPQGGRNRLKITVMRKKYTGAIGVELRNLPGQVQAGNLTIAEKEHVGFIDVMANPAAVEGSRDDVYALGSGLGRIKHEASSLPVKLTVLGPPFALEVPSTPVSLAYGSETKVPVKVTRRDYKGPITLELRNLPNQITASKATIPADKDSAQILLSAGPKVAYADHKLNVVGVASAATNRLALSPTFVLRVEGKPFELRIDSGTLPIVQGASAKLKVTAVRKGYKGPIKLELKNLPKRLIAGGGSVLANQTSAEITITALDSAKIGNQGGVFVLGTTVATEARTITSPGFNVNVLGPFELTVQPTPVQLIEGGKVVLKIQAVRRTYDGPITLELRNIPETLTAGKATIPEGQNTAEIELSAPAIVKPAEKTNVHVLGTTAARGEISSPNFTISLGRKPFELRVLPTQARVTTGEKTTVKVIASRKDYKGPIALDLQKLPPLVKVAKATIPEGKDEVELVLEADVKATPSSVADVIAVGTGGNQTIASAPFNLYIQAGLFDLVMAPPLVSLVHGEAAKVKLTATRKGYQGPIAVDLRNLPKGVSAGKVSLGAGENETVLEIKADFGAAEGDEVAVHARGTATLAGKSVTSPCITVSIASLGQRTPGLAVKVAPTVIQLRPGESIKLKVDAVRKGYNGPVTVEVRNLPADVEVQKAMIPEGKSAAEIVLTAKAEASPSSRGDVVVVGIATAADNQVFASPHLTVKVQR